jgi:Tol biopolymer transport system component
LAGLAAVAAVLGIALAVYISRHTSENPPQQLQTAILPPPGEGFWAHRTKVGAVSPDGKFLAVIAMANGQGQLWLRRLDASEAQPIAGTEGATSPFWSPDSHYIGFFVPGKLKKVDISGGKVSDICRAGQFNMGGSWSSQGVIVFAPFADVLRRVSDRGGTPEPIPGLPLSSDSLGQYWPEFLPDGKHILYLDWRYPGQGRENSVWIGSVEGEKPRRLALSATNVQYSSGYLLFIRDGDLFAQKFDLSRFDLSGSTLPVARHIQYNPFFEYGLFTASTNGILIYAPAGTGVNSVLTWMDRNGGSLGVLGEPGRVSQQAISPDGKRVAVGIDTNIRQKIFVYDVDRGTRILVDNSSLDLDGPHWSQDGKQLVYRFLEGKSSGMVLHASDGSGEERQLGGKFDGVVTVDDWSLDGHYLTFTLAKFAGLENWQNTLRVARIEGDMKSELDIDNAELGKFSPDGRWLAFRDDISGQVYVVPVSGRGGRVAVSSSGGNHPRWRGDGQELFYVANDQTLISVQLHESPQEFHVLSTRPLFRLQLPDNIGHYDVSRDGKRFLVNVRTQKEQDAPLMIVTNWAAQF